MKLTKIGFYSEGQVKKMLAEQERVLKQKISEVLKCQRCGVCMLHSNELKEMVE